MQQVSQIVTQSFNMSASQLVRERVARYISQPAKKPAIDLLHPLSPSQRQSLSQSISHSQSVFEATGSILINPWHAGQRAGPVDEVVVSVLSASGVVTLSPQRGPALFEPDVGRQASPAVRLHPPPLLSSCVSLALCCCCCLLSSGAGSSSSC